MGKKILEELHEGVCSSYTGGGALAAIAIRIGYYWLSLREDAMNLIRICLREDAMNLIRIYDKC